MEYGLIKDTTLTSIVDSLRDKGIIKKYKYGDIVLQYKSDNATSLEDPTPTREHSLQKFTVDFSGITNAASIEFEIFPVVIAQSDTTDPTIAVALIKYEKRSMAAASYENIHRDTEKVSFTTSLINTEITFQDNGTASSKQKDWAGIVVKAYPLDSSGNRIQGYTDELVQYTPGAMAEALSNSEIPVAPPEEAFTITGDCSYRFANSGWDWFISTYDNKLNTKDIQNLNNIFVYSTLQKIPFTINVNKNCVNFNRCFNLCTKLTESPKIRGPITFSTSLDFGSCIESCKQVEDFEDLFEPEIFDGFSTVKVTSQYSCVKPVTFSSCDSLKELPSWWYKQKLCEDSTAYPSSNYSLYYYGFRYCGNLRRVLNAPVWKCTGSLTSNYFNNTFYENYMLTDFTFETNNGQPIEVNWKSQTIDLLNSYGVYKTNAISGKDATKRITDDASYQLLKDDPERWTTDVNYARYDHDSAVRTINSLPDTSAYLATAGGTNTIKFKGAVGSNTDGGAINTLTAEEIAVAAAKGWTVTLS